MKVQIKMANLVARMAEHSLLAQEYFARENIIKPLVTLLSTDVFVDEPNFKVAKHSFHSIVQINKEMERNQLHKGFGSTLSMHNSNGSKGGHHKKEKEDEDPEVKLRLKISCAEALWMLARGSVLS